MTQEKKKCEIYDDKYLEDNIVECRTNFKKSCEVQRNYIYSAETPEEFARRQDKFRCVGW